MLAVGEAGAGMVAPVCAVHPERMALHTCPRCGTFACDDCFVRGRGGFFVCIACQRRGQGLAPVFLGPGELPWDERGQVGITRAFWRTCVRMVKAPRATLERTPPEAPVSSSFLFSFLANLVRTLPMVLLLTVPAVPNLLRFLTRQEGVNRTVVSNLATFLPGLLGFVVGLSLVQPFVLAGFDHLALRCVGARPLSYRVTLRGWSLAQGPVILGLIPIPICGPAILWLWTWLLSIHAYERFHRISTARALGATVLSVVFLMLAWGGFYLFALSVLEPLAGSGSSP